MWYLDIKKKLVLKHLLPTAKVIINKFSLVFGKSLADEFDTFFFAITYTQFRFTGVNIKITILILREDNVFKRFRTKVT